MSRAQSVIHVAQAVSLHGLHSRRYNTGSSVGGELWNRCSFIPEVPEEALRYVLDWVRRKMRDMARGLRK
jgi:hypothetical protein